MSTNTLLCNGDVKIYTKEGWYSPIVKLMWKGVIGSLIVKILSKEFTITVFINRPRWYLIFVTVLVSNDNTVY